MSNNPKTKKILVAVSERDYETIKTQFPKEYNTVSDFIRQTALRTIKGKPKKFNGQSSCDTSKLEEQVKILRDLVEHLIDQVEDIHDKLNDESEEHEDSLTTEYMKILKATRQFIKSKKSVRSNITANIDGKINMKALKKALKLLDMEEFL